MTNPISGIAGPGEITGINQSAGTKTGQAAAEGNNVAPPPGADSANVGQTESLIETINATVAAVPTVNQDQVSALRQAIANGTYQVSPQEVAKQLLNSEQALTNPVMPGD
jgi:negative regulator of flagellin synthesis FlgM